MSPDYPPEAGLGALLTLLCCSGPRPGRRQHGQAGLQFHPGRAGGQQLLAAPGPQQQLHRQLPPPALWAVPEPEQDPQAAGSQAQPVVVRVVHGATADRRDGAGPSDPAVGLSMPARHTCDDGWHEHKYLCNELLRVVAGVARCTVPFAAGLPKTHTSKAV